MKPRRDWLLDLICVLLLIGAGVLHWPSGELSLVTSGPEPPAWGTVRDALLDGPDAGEWARSMVALHEGRFQDLETHRLPAWLILVNAVMSFEPDVVRAGHLCNHLLNLALGIIVFGIGRLGGNRWIGLAGGALAMMGAHAMAVSLRFGVDAAVVTMVPLSILGALLACRRWPLGIVAGAIAAVVSATHFSTLPYALPALALVLMAGGKGHRWLASSMYLIGFGLVMWGLTRVFPVSTMEEFQVAIANGIAPGYQGGGRVSSWASALQIVDEGKATAINRAVAQLTVQTRPSWLPWQLALILPWVGVVGVGLKPMKAEALRTSSTARRALARCDLGLGLALLFCLAPLPVFAAAQAPLRYADNLSPVGAMLLARGLGSCVWVVWALLRKSLPSLHTLRPVFFAALGLGVLAGAVRDAEPARHPLYPSLDELAYWQLGQMLKDHFPEGSGVASPVREALVAGNLRFCPQRICPEEATEGAFWHCMGVLKEQCAGDGPVGYVVTDAKLYDPNAVARKDMDLWVAEKWSPVAEIELEGFHAKVFAIEREEIPSLIRKSGPIPGPAPVDVVGPPMDDVLGQTKKGKSLPAPVDQYGRPLPGLFEAPPPHKGRIPQ